MVHELMYDAENDIVILKFNYHFQFIDVKPVFEMTKELLENKPYRQMMIVMHDVYVVENRETREATSEKLSELNISEIAFVGGSASNRMIARVLIKTGIIKLKGDFFKNTVEAINWLKSKR